jgi:hypothetical protein
MSKNLKTHIKNLSPPRLFTSYPLPDIKHLAIHLLGMIPKMEETGDVALQWLWKPKDIGVYSKAEYEAEAARYRDTHKMKVSVGDTVWHYDYTHKGRKRRCLIRTEIWYKEDEDMMTSPFAIIFGQMMGAGLHFTKMEWVDQPE